MLRECKRIASIEPALTQGTPREIIGLERSALRFASSAIGHIRLQSLGHGAAARG
jgi:hypothetical protein